MISGSSIHHASTCMDLALENFENGDDAAAIEYIKKCIDDLQSIIRQGA